MGRLAPRAQVCRSLKGSALGPVPVVLSMFFSWWRTELMHTISMSAQSSRSSALRSERAIASLGLETCREDAADDGHTAVEQHQQGRCDADQHATYRSRYGRKIHYRSALTSSAKASSKTQELSALSGSQAVRS